MVGDQPDLEALWRSRHRDAAAFAEQVASLPESPVTGTLRSRVLWGRGDGAAALTAASSAERELPRRSVWRARALETVGICLAELGIDDDAHRYFAEAATIYQEAGDHLGRVSVLQNSATQSIHSVEVARELFLEALRAAEPLDDPTLAGIIMLNVAEASHRRGDPPDAVESWIVRAARRLDGTWPEMHVKARCLLAQHLLDSDRIEEAAAILAELPGPQDVPSVTSRTLLGLARADLATRRGRPEEAAGILRSCADGQQSPHDAIEVRVRLVACLEEAGDLPGALEASKEATRMSLALVENDAARQARALDAWHRTQLLRRDQEAAEERAASLERALAERQAALDELQQAHEQIRELSTRDALTGLHNRQHLLDTGAAQVATAGPDSPVQVALLDLDHFKRINDSLGHDAGDVALQTFARLLRTHLPADDLVARYGGEEFVVIRPPHPGGPHQDLAGDLDALRPVLARTRPTAPGGRSLPPVTMSAGVATVRAPDLPGALRLADQRMYAAKRDGGDRVAGDRPDLADG